MNERDLRGILQSDFQLWERSETVEDGGMVTKIISLPHGIGDFRLTFEGINNAQGRLSAVGIWGQSIRDAVNDAVGDEAVSARAAQKAARVGPDDGNYGGLSESDPYDAGAVPVPAQETVSPLSEPATLSTDTSNRIDELRRFRVECAKRIKGLDLEIKALSAYLEVMNAQQDTTETPRGEGSEDQEEIS